jgi:hypothetical protein
MYGITILRWILKVIIMMTCLTSIELKILLYQIGRMFTSALRPVAPRIQARTHLDASVDAGGGASVALVNSQVI